MFKHFELKLSDCPKNNILQVKGVVLLNGSFLYKLKNPSMELLLFHAVVGGYFHEQFRCKLWQAFELELLAARNGIPNLVIPDIVKTDNVSCNGFVDHFPIIRQELSGL